MRDPIFLNETDPAAGDTPPADEPAWAPSQEEWQQTQQLLQQQQEFIQSVQQQQAGAQERPVFDPYADDADQQLRAIIREETAPYAGFQQDAVLKEAEERARDILQDLASSGGEFDIDTARVRADHLLGEMQERYGFGPKAAEAALAAAAEQQREFERAVGEAYHNRKINELQGLRGVPREQPVNGTPAASQMVTHEGGDEQDLVRAYFPTSR